MPLYEYVCDECQKEFEFLIRGQEKPVCPKCGGESLQQQLSVVAAHTSGKSLPVCSTPPAGGCGLPQCGTGRCAM